MGYLRDDHELMAEPLRISSRQNPRVKDAIRLRDSRERQRTGRFIIDGAREIVRALKCGIRPAEAFVGEELITSAEAREAATTIQSTRAEVFEVSAEVHSKLAF